MDLYKNYQKLYKLSQTQTECIKEDDYDRLLAVLEQKQEIIEKADEIDMEDYLESRENSEQALTSLQELMTEIKELEDKNRELLTENKEALAEKMFDFSQKQKSREGYYQKSGYEAKFIDKRS